LRFEFLGVALRQRARRLRAPRESPSPGSWRYKAKCPSLAAWAPGSTSLYKPSSVTLLGHPKNGGDHSSKNGNCSPSQAAYPQARASHPQPGTPRFAAPGMPAYAALLPMGFALPPALPRARWALTPPFHPYRRVVETSGGGLFSVALSSALPLPGVTRHRALRSSDFPPDA
jgi:hypothetical protein